ncbi:MAG TPA: hypothetical protein PK152_01245 [Anaerolineales bacterium]|jgi:hypothetical protein|nr:hypothetical protein [Anaerolineae bacterium]HRJ56535.1 hypothetical protein [Anaerolineales bacterium]HRK87727.1 hypothetical protein [Anaerolineales bacterium]
MKETSQAKRSILAILAVIVGLFMIAVAPFLIQTSLERVVTELQIVSAQKPAYASGIPLFSYAFPLYRGLIFIGGIALLLLALPIYRGEEWTFPVALLASAFPSAGGMFMFMPYVSFVDGFPIPMAVSIVGLIFFWSLILLRNVDKWIKWGQFLALTFAGMLTTHAFIVGIGNLRTLMTRPEKPMYNGLGTWVLAWSQPIQWICVILLFIAIYKIAERKFSGWWLALVAVTSLTVIDVPMQIIRLTMTDSTALDYTYGMPVMLGMFIVLLMPKFKKALIAE